MKTKGSTFLYEQERNEDLMRCFREKASSVSVLVISDVFNDIVNSPSSRFWVSESRAAVVIGNMMRNKDALSGMNPQKKEMYEEIFRQANKAISEGATGTIYEIVRTIVRSPAPKFYLTPDSAKVIYYKYKKKWHDRMRKRAALYANISQLWKEKSK